MVNKALLRGGRLTSHDNNRFDVETIGPLKVVCGVTSCVSCVASASLDIEDETGQNHILVIAKWFNRKVFMR